MADSPSDLSSDAVDFPAAFREELDEAVYPRRKARSAADASLPPPPPPQGGTSPVQEEALEQDLCGLAISGGGIRSATFGLGVLQGLAAMGVLKRFDYLSTVSGGGFIGSWLSAWIHREGFSEVEKQLQPTRSRDAGDLTKSARANLPRPETDVEPEPEPKQITRLRRYSNYLAPIPSMFSVDGWVLIAIYIRNLLLNQFVLLLATLGVVFAARSISDAFDFFSEWRGPIQAASVLAMASLALGAAVRRLHVTPLQPIEADLDTKMRASKAFGLAAGAQTPSASVRGLRIRMLRWLRRTRIRRLLPTLIRWLRIALHRERRLSAAEMGRERWQVVLLCLLAAALGSVALVQPDCREVVEGQFWLLFLVVVVVGAVVHFFLAGAFPRVRAAGRFYGFFAGGLLGVPAAFALGYFARAVGSFEDGNMWIAVFAPPLLLLMFVLANFLQVGLLGTELTPYEREWWSGLNARLLMAAGGWALTVGCVEFCPTLYDMASNSEWRATLATLLGSSWVAATASGLWAAWASDGGGNRKSRIRELLALIAPWVFLAGLFAVVTLLAYGATFHLDLPCYLQSLEWPSPGVWPDVHKEWVYTATSLVIAVLCLRAAWWFGVRFGVNKFSLHDLYSLRLIRCYLGASNPNRDPDPLTNFDERDDLHLAQLATASRVTAEGKELGWGDTGPFHILNGALNRSVGTVVPGQEDESLAFLDRRAESFTFTPLRCGSKATKYCWTNEFSLKPQDLEEAKKVSAAEAKLAAAKTSEADAKVVAAEREVPIARPKGVRLGTAVATSGAAVSPNGGFHTALAVSALLTVFNLRLGAWFGNPRDKKHRGDNNPPPWYLLKELFTSARADGEYVYVSDGGHFENMGVYELIRRRCRFIVALDPFGDPKRLEENLGNLVRKVRIDFGIRIEVDSNATRTGPDGSSSGHVAVGRIFYGDVHRPKDPGCSDAAAKAEEKEDLQGPTYDYRANQGIFVYLKAGLTGDEPADLLGYRASNPDFPNDPILDQNFDEAQFESYRVLGLHTVNALFKEVGEGDDCGPVSLLRGSQGRKRLQEEPTRKLFERIYHVWLAPPAELQAEYLRFNEAFAAIHEKLRSTPSLQHFGFLLHPALGRPTQLGPCGRTEESRLAEQLIAVEMATLLENAFLGLRLDTYHKHPLNAGWIDVFRRWHKLLDEHKLIDGYKAFCPDFRRFMLKTLPTL